MEHSREQEPHLGKGLVIILVGKGRSGRWQRVQQAAQRPHTCQLLATNTLSLHQVQPLQLQHWGQNVLEVVT